MQVNEDQNNSSEKPVEIDLTQNQEQEEKAQKEQIKQNSLELFYNLKSYLSNVFNIKEGAEVQQTVEGIQRDIDFKGHKAWILACSIFIASIGLNTNSAAAIIGAMLISPLMGPILGMGLAIGTHDFKMLMNSARNLGIAVGISIIVSTLYFVISPIDEPQSELMARTRPTLLDAMIAILGGLAGIIAGSRKEKSNVIPGVAIATALMPPLCTAGFGLANFKWDFFFGALYLFLLNSIFICLSTWVVVKYLDFPKKAFIDAVREKKYNRYILGIVFVVLIPSGWLFFGVIQETVFQSRAQAFINENFSFNNSEILSTKLTYSDTIKRIDIYMMGEPLNDDVRKNLENRMATYNLENTSLKLHQGGTSQSEFGKMTQEVRVGIIEDLYKKNENLLKTKDSTIQSLSTRLTRIEGDTIPVSMLAKEMKAQYASLESFSYAKQVKTGMDGKVDTIPTVILNFKPNTSTIDRARESGKIEAWLKVRLNEPTIDVQSY